MTLTVEKMQPCDRCKASKPICSELRRECYLAAKHIEDFSLAQHCHVPDVRLVIDCSCFDGRTHVR